MRLFLSEMLHLTTKKFELRNIVEAMILVTLKFFELWINLVTLFLLRPSLIMFVIVEKLKNCFDELVPAIFLKIRIINPY